ncbi:MAG: helix-turn-helix domain-containing protein [Patescibacteria group bacterium]
MTQDGALKILKTGANVFLTGEPGSGKTHTVNAFVRYLREHNIEPAITASTGIAATHLGGMTIHSWSGIGVKSELSDYDLDFITQNERLVRRILKTKILIIDEISMLSAGTLAMVDQVCRAIRGEKGVFGDLQVVFAGDFFQLPPVFKRHRDSDDEIGPQFAYQSPVWAEAKPVVCYLHEQHRQEDKNFLDILTALRRGDLTNQHLAHLEKRMLTSEAEIPTGITQLFSHNENVDRLNDSELAKLKTSARVYQMTAKGAPHLIESLKKNCLSPETLTLKVGAKVMFTKNSLKGEYVNGTTGEVTGFDRVSGQPIIKTRSGKIITAEESEWMIENDGKVLARVSQIPLRLAWAITVHKSQGLSLDSAVIDLSQAFEYGQGYVALSRVRSLNGLHLLGLNERALLVNPAVRVRDLEFRRGSDEASKHFRIIEPAELAKMHHNFIKAVGGVIPTHDQPLAKLKQIKNKGNEGTLILIKEKKSLAEIAEARGLTVGTIIKHLEDLVKFKKLSVKDITYLETGQEDALKEIKNMLKKNSSQPLKTIFEKLGGIYSYEQIRLARLLS